jgi:hypothetical protein
MRHPPTQIDSTDCNAYIAGKDAVGGNTEKVEEVNLAEAIRWRFAPCGGVELEPFPRAPMRPAPEFGE